MAVVSELAGNNESAGLTVVPDCRDSFDASKVRVEVCIDGGVYYAYVIDERDIRVYREILPDDFRSIGRVDGGGYQLGGKRSSCFRTSHQ